MKAQTKFTTTNGAGRLASIEGHTVPASFPSYPCGPLSFSKGEIMKTYYTLIGIYKSEDCKYEIIFGDYDREVVEDEKDCSHDNYRCLKIITTSDAQADIQARVDQENINSGHTKGEWKNTLAQEKLLTALTSR